LARAVFPPDDPRKLAVPVLLLVLALPACGGSGPKSPGTQLVRGSGYSFEAPADWAVSRARDVVRATKEQALISVTVFPRVRAVKGIAWDVLVREMDRAARSVAAQEGAELAKSETVSIDSHRARAYSLERGDVEERLAFLIAGRRQYQLFCQNADDACDRLLESFSLS
jgi:hypothetical protein